MANNLKPPYEVKKLLTPVGCKAAAFYNIQACELLLEDHHPLVQEGRGSAICRVGGEPKIGIWPALDGA